ncbi:murein hydrolase activator EnvC family protein [Kribbella caucasensis]|uniref:murein hydrolase activator EnvC family protein n=1 Tax=Kribbella caucasensis TaxID=2512215 RepID=UPI00105C09FC|nr:M23 family metallopeptidase [Kribbella sp. VKM Ac-2527]
MNPSTTDPHPRLRRPPYRRLLRLLFLVLCLSFAQLSPTASAAPGHPAVWPLDPRPQVIRAFDQPAKPWLPGHRGIDLSGTPGQPVRAATAGTITYAAPLAGRGVIVVTTGHFRTTYEPVIATLPVGTPVTPGQPIGHLSAAGSHCPPATCLHWGLRQADTYVDPLSLLPHKAVRLLPLAPPPTSPTNPAPSTSSPLAGPTAQPTPSPLPGAAAQPTSNMLFGQQPPAATSPGSPSTSPEADRPRPPQASPESVPGSLLAATMVGIAAIFVFGGRWLTERH